MNDFWRQLLTMDLGGGQGKPILAPAPKNKTTAKEDFQILEVVPPMEIVPMREADSFEPMDSEPMEYEDTDTLDSSTPQQMEDFNTYMELLGVREPSSEGFQRRKKDQKIDFKRKPDSDKKINYRQNSGGSQVASLWKELLQ